MSRKKNIRPESGAPRLRIVADNPKRVRVVEAPEDAAPFQVQAVALEEDTSLVLSADSKTIHDSGEHPIRLMSALYAEPRRTPGSVVVKGANPSQFLAIIHDFDQEPSFREDWVWRALGEIFIECDNRKIPALKLAPLGTRYGGLTFSYFREQLDFLLNTTECDCLQQIWLVTSSSSGPNTRNEPHPV